MVPFSPETIWSYEVGMRADWMDGRLRTNVTAFYSDLEDLQTTAATPDGQFLTTNAGGLEVPGIEAEITALPTDNWQIFAALGWQSAEYRDLISLIPSEALIKLIPLEPQPTSILGL